MVCVLLQGHHGPFGVEVEHSQQNCTVPVHEADTPKKQLLGVGIMVMVWAIAKRQQKAARIRPQSANVRQPKKVFGQSLMAFAPLAV